MTKQTQPTIPETIKRGTVLSFKEGDTYKGRIHIVSSVDTENNTFTTQYGNAINWNPDKWEIIEPQTHHLSLILDIMETSQMAENGAKRALIQRQETLGKHLDTIEQLEQTVSAQKLTIEKHDRVVADKDKEIAALKKQIIGLKDGKHAAEFNELQSLKEKLEAAEKEIERLNLSFDILTVDPVERVAESINTLTDIVSGLIERDIDHAHMLADQRAQQIKERYEYKTLLLDVDGKYQQGQDSQLTQHCDTGWEIFSIGYTQAFDPINQEMDYSSIVTLRRPKTQSQPENHAIVEKKLDEAVAEALQRKPDGSHIGILTMDEVAQIGYAQNQEKYTPPNPLQ